MRTRVKICGFTRIEDAVAAARLGVDAIGLVFHPGSPRHVEPAQARAIALAMPAFVSVAGLFVDAERQRVQEVLEQVPLDLLQFHGDELADYCRGFERPYIKAVRVNASTDLLGLSEHYRTARALLLDADDPAAKGGTGTCFDWSLVPSRCELPLILAGGLRIENVRSGMARARPYGVDVSSGVESAKGIKDQHKMAVFLKEVYEFDHKHNRLD
jgi:phosphoribosylanthranilate isomerase